eukprot:scaffold2562_cov116-Isochrysis_galbana.AAC.1
MAARCAVTLCAGAFPMCVRRWTNKCQRVHDVQRCPECVLDPVMPRAKKMTCSGGEITTWA